MTRRKGLYAELHSNIENMDEAIQDAIRIAAIVFSVSVTLEDPLIADAALKAAA